MDIASAVVVCGQRAMVMLGTVGVAGGGGGDRRSGETVTVLAAAREGVAVTVPAAARHGVVMVMSTVARETLTTLVNVAAHIGVAEIVNGVRVIVVAVVVVAMIVVAVVVPVPRAGIRPWLDPRHRRAPSSRSNATGRRSICRTAPSRRMCSIRSGRNASGQHSMPIATTIEHRYVACRIGAVPCILPGGG